jgi:hypothetical protein
MILRFIAFYVGSGPAILFNQLRSMVVMEIVDAKLNTIFVGSAYLGKDIVDVGD